MYKRVVVHNFFVGQWKIFEKTFTKTRRTGKSKSEKTVRRKPGGGARAKRAFLRFQRTANRAIDRVAMILKKRRIEFIRFFFFFSFCSCYNFQKAVRFMSERKVDFPETNIRELIITLGL